ncbi:MAG: fatty acid--CoA ligase family protein [Bacteroidota bacterium]|nr:fatty acid--CoA ligase family protein [Bacteroidota bacterium]
MFNNLFVNKIFSFTDNVAVIINDISFTYVHLNESVKKACKFLIEQKIIPGKSVVIKADYNFESISLFLALIENRNIIIPITTKNTVEFNDRLNEANCDFIITIVNGEFETEIINKDQANTSHYLISEIVEKDVSGLILFSSGSTGRPKAMIHNLDNITSTFMDKRGKPLIFLVFLSFDHIGGLNTLFNCLAMGATIVIPNERKPEIICNLIQKYKISILPSSPTFLNLLLISKAHEHYDLSSLKMITYGTEPMPESLLLKLRTELPHVRFMQTFGTSETGIVKTQSKSSSSLFLKFEDPNQEHKIVDGELWLRSKTQILGYLNHSNESFTKDGWFKTGDIVEVLEDGYLKIIGRSKEIINIGGEKVLPMEVENLILQIDGVNDCVVFGQQNAIMGQIVTANISINEKSDPVQIKKEVIKLCKEKLDNYKIPSKVNIVSMIDFNDRFKKDRKLQ